MDTGRNLFVAAWLTANRYAPLRRVTIPLQRRLYHDHERNGRPGQNRSPGPCQRGRFEGVRFAPRRRRPVAAAGGAAGRQRPGRPGGAGGGHVPGFAGPPVFDRGPHSRYGRRRGGGGQVRRPGGEGPLRPEAPQRLAAREGHGAPGGYRHHLRGPAQRHQSTPRPCA